MTFKVLPESKQEYFSRKHNPLWTKPKSHSEFMSLIRKQANIWLSKNKRFKKYNKENNITKIRLFVDKYFYEN